MSIGDEEHPEEILFKRKTACLANKPGTVVRAYVQAQHSGGGGRKISEFQVIVKEKVEPQLWVSGFERGGWVEGMSGSSFQTTHPQSSMA